MGGSEVDAVRALILASAFFIAAPAVAQEIYCEGMIEGESGEVVAGFDLNRDGSIKSRSISWLPTREEYEVFGSSVARSPRLILQFREASDGDVVGPSMANVVFTHYSAPGSNSGPSFSQLTVRATLASSGKEVSWKANEARNGESELARLLRETKAPRLTVNVLGPDGRPMISAEFDLTGQDEVHKLLPQARAKGEREIANYKRLVSQGKKLDSCPAL